MTVVASLGGRSWLETDSIQKRSIYLGSRNLAFLGSEFHLERLRERNRPTVHLVVKYYTCLGHHYLGPEEEVDGSRQRKGHSRCICSDDMGSTMACIATSA